MEHYAPFGNGLLTSTSETNASPTARSPERAGSGNRRAASSRVAAAGADPVDASVALRLALMLEGGLMSEAIPNEANGKETCLNNNKANDCAAHDDPKLSSSLLSNTWTPALVPDQFRTRKPRRQERHDSDGIRLVTAASGWRSFARRSTLPIARGVT